MADFEEIVGGIELEPEAITLLRTCLTADWDESHPSSVHGEREAAHRVIDGVVDLLRDYWGSTGFDRFVEADEFVD